MRLRARAYGRRWQRCQLIPNKAGDHIYEAVKSAVANAENNFDLATDDLVVAQVLADEGRSLKRFRATRTRPRLGNNLALQPHHGRGQGEGGIAKWVIKSIRLASVWE